ncbi:MAG: hypothetical protein Kow0031_18810 [Anaerolineae bacterium]
MSRHRRRTVAFASSALALDYSHPEFTPVIEALYGDMPAAPPGDPPVTYRLRAGGNQFTLHRNDSRIYSGDSLPQLADLLLGNSCHHLADRSHGGLLFHAGAVERQGRGLILPGTMGAGKTTLTAWLLTRGFNYLSDEMVFVGQGEERLQPLPRPLNLKRPSRAVLAPWLDFEARAGQIISTDFIDLLPPALLNPATRLSRPPLRLIIFPRYQSGAEFRLEALSKAQAGAALMQCLINARNLPGHGFDEIGRLARLAPAYRLTYAHFEQLGDSLESLLAGA